MKSLLGDEFPDFLQYYNSGRCFRGLRVNTLKCTADRLGFELKPTPFCSDGYYLPDELKHVGAHPLHHAGAFYVQEPSATSAVPMLGVQKGEKVLDLCAAPGGKSTQIAAALGGEGLLWSNEIVRSRALILLSNIERLGVRNAAVSSCHPEQLCEKLHGYFDRVLVDAPCSGEGMFRKNSAAEQEWSVEHVRSCSERQLKILNSAKLALREGGVLVYSTCTFSREENEGVIEAFLRENPDFVPEDSSVCFGRPSMVGARRIFPMDGGEGHFAARLKKLSPCGSAGDEAFKPRKTADDILKFYDENFVGRPFGSRIEIIKDKIYALPEVLPSFDMAGVLRRGVLLGEIRKNRVEPHHCAFAAAKPADCARSIDFAADSDEIKKFLHGEEIGVSSDLKGYTAVCVNGITLGFGKASGGRLKNKYPKGLRNLK